MIVTGTEAEEMFTHHPPPTVEGPMPELSMAYNAHVPLGAEFWKVEVRVAEPSVAAYAASGTVGAGEGKIKFGLPVIDVGL